MKFKLSLLAIAVFTLLIAGCSKKEPAPQPQTETETPASEAAAPAAAETSFAPKPAASIDGLVYVKGGPVTFEKGKVTVVEFWATWCGPCRTSIPHLTEVQEQFKDQGVTVLGISNEKPETVKPFVAKMAEKMDYTVAVDSNRKVSDGYMEAYGQNGIPTAFIVDGNGKVVWVGHPLSDMDEVLSKVVDGSFDAQVYAKEKAEGEALERKLMGWYREYFTKVQSGAPIEETRPIAEKLIEAAPAGALNAFAWQILSNENKSARDLEIAMKAAEKANTQTNAQDPMVLDTYALGLFENGKAKEAVTAQEKAIALAAGNERMVDDMKARLETFKAALSTPESPETTK